MVVGSGSTCGKRDSEGWVGVRQAKTLRVGFSVEGKTWTNTEEWAGAGSRGGGWGQTPEDPLCCHNECHGSTVQKTVPLSESAHGFLQDVPFENWLMTFLWKTPRLAIPGKNCTNQIFLKQCSDSRKPHAGGGGIHTGIALKPFWKMESVLIFWWQPAAALKSADTEISTFNHHQLTSKSQQEDGLWRDPRCQPYVFQNCEPQIEHFLSWVFLWKLDFEQLLQWAADGWVGRASSSWGHSWDGALSANAPFGASLASVPRASALEATLSHSFLSRRWEQPTTVGRLISRSTRVLATIVPDRRGWVMLTATLAPQDCISSSRRRSTELPVAFALSGPWACFLGPCVALSADRSLKPSLTLSLDPQLAGLLIRPWPHLGTRSAVLASIKGQLLPPP